MYDLGYPIGSLASPRLMETLNINTETTFVAFQYEQCYKTDMGLERCTFKLGYLAQKHDIHYLSSIEFPNLKNGNVINSSNMCVMEHLEWDDD
uniref:Uncharacterized protein n=1 Tax=Solanum lycopersicum TaxID=4081 RepID=A0A3Q7G7S5_SOLLC